MAQSAGFLIVQSAVTTSPLFIGHLTVTKYRTRPCPSGLTVFCRVQCASVCNVCPRFCAHLGIITPIIIPLVCNHCTHV